MPHGLNFSTTTISSMFFTDSFASWVDGSYQCLCYKKETVKSGTRAITPKTCSSSGEVLLSFVQSFFRPRIQSWNPATGCGA
jgi:hypothetical protein